MLGEDSWSNTLWLGDHVLLWGTVLFLGFLLMGTLRAMALLKWRLEQLEATTPSRLGRSGLKPGKKAPDFTLPATSGAAVSLCDFTGRKVLLVFTQTGCGPCQEIMPELNRPKAEDVQILAVNRGDLEATRAWAAELGVRFPVLIQDGLGLSRKYEVFATPFAFLIDEKGIIVSKGIITSKQHIGYVLSGARYRSKDNAESEPSTAENAAAEASVSHSVSRKEVHHV